MARKRFFMVGDRVKKVSGRLGGEYPWGHASDYDDRRTRAVNTWMAQAVSPDTVEVDQALPEPVIDQIVAPLVFAAFGGQHRLHCLAEDGTRHVAQLAFAS